MRGALPAVAAEAALLFAQIALRRRNAVGSILWVPASDFLARPRVATAIALPRMLNGEGKAGAAGCNARRFENRFQLAGADHRVHFRNVLADLVAVALHQAARNDQLGGTAFGLVTRHFENGVDRLLLGRIDEAARIDDQDLGVFRPRSQARAGAIQQAHHDL